MLAQDLLSSGARAPAWPVPPGTHLRPSESGGINADEGLSTSGLSVAGKHRTWHPSHLGTSRTASLRGPRGPTASAPVTPKHTAKCTGQGCSGTSVVPGQPRHPDGRSRPGGGARKAVLHASPRRIPPFLRSYNQHKRPRRRCIECTAVTADDPEPFPVLTLVLLANEMPWGHLQAERGRGGTGGREDQRATQGAVRGGGPGHGEQARRLPRKPSPGHLAELGPPQQKRRDAWAGVDRVWRAKLGTGTSVRRHQGARSLRMPCELKIECGQMI